MVPQHDRRLAHHARGRPPILTGRYPDGVGLLPTVEEHPDNLFTLLQGTYDLHVQESVTALCPGDLCGQGSLAPGHPLHELTLDALDLWQRQLFGGGDDRQVDFAIRQSDPTPRPPSTSSPPAWPSATTPPSTSSTPSTPTSPGTTSRRG